MREEVHLTFLYSVRLAGWFLPAAVALVVPGLAIAVPVPVTVTITSVECTQDDECDAAGIEAAGESWPDFYAKIFINGVMTQTVRAPDDQKKIEPQGWAATVTVDDSVTPTVPITIQIWDHDSTSGDDLGDASPQADHNNLDLVLNLANGFISGDSSTACATGDGVDTDDEEYYPMKVCFDITGLDQDGDGLMDNWEKNGFDADGNGTIDIDLPGWGASPTHKDLFVELDYETTRPPTRNGIAALKRAFALAPVSNPDGKTGINLHVDVGNLSDPTANEAGVSGTCTNGIDDDGSGLTDGLDPTCIRYVDVNAEGVAADCNNDSVDNDGDGQIDGNDPQCQVGDNFGGGEGLPPTVGACGLDTVFASTKALRFNPQRARIFHYAIQAVAPVAAPGAPPLNCLGGQGEIGGNDFISHNRDAGTLMHELGHNLNLQHGGSDSNNCKPNYISVMNYNLQGGIPRVSGGVIIDYSPPRQAFDGSSRSAAPLGPLVENTLNENNPIDPGDPVNQAIFMSLTNTMVTVPLNARPDYSGDLSDPPFESPVVANIDNGIAATAMTPTIGSPGCSNGSTNSTLNGDSDWSRIALAFRQFAAAADGAVIPSDETGATEDEINQIFTDIHRTNLKVSLAATPNPVAAGTIATYVATVTNAGPNPATGPSLTLKLPPETARTGLLPSKCREATPGMTICTFDPTLAGASSSVTLQAALPDDFVYNAGAPLPITATASVEDLAGTESDPSDNSVSTSITAVAVADLSITSFDVDNPPVQMLIGESVVINLSSAISSAGPSSPMDTFLTLNAKADGGVFVWSTWLKTSQVALKIGEDRRLNDHAVILCRTLGKHLFHFTHGIAPARTPDSDPDLSNNDVRTSLAVECLQEHN